MNAGPVEDDREYSVYCVLEGSKVKHTQDLGAVQTDWDADGEISGVEIMNARRIKIDGK